MNSGPWVQEAGRSFTSHHLEITSAGFKHMDMAPLAGWTMHAHRLNLVGHKDFESPSLVGDIIQNKLAVCPKVRLDHGNSQFMIKPEATIADANSRRGKVTDFNCVTIPLVVSRGTWISPSAFTVRTKLYAPYPILDASQKWWNSMESYSKPEVNTNLWKRNSDLSNMVELPSFSPPASESTLQYRTSPLRQARIRPKLKAAPVYI